MARSSECTGLYAQKVLDTADIVRDAIYRQRDGPVLLPSASFQVQLLGLSLQLPSMSIGGSNALSESICCPSDRSDFAHVERSRCRAGHLGGRKDLSHRR